MTTTGRRPSTFSALKVRNFRLYMMGQAVSQSGTWMQTVALAALVLQLTDQGTAVGLVFSLQFLPILVLAPLGGMIADGRRNNRAALCWTQAISGLLALVLGLLVATDTVQLWMVYTMAAALGLVNAADLPIRQTFVYAVAGPEEITNAVSINIIVLNLARIIGPGLGGVIITTVGVAPCFLYNAASFMAVVVVLLRMRSSELHQPTPVSSTDRRIRAGISYVRATPELLIPLMMLALIGTLSWEFPVSLPLIATFTFHRGPGMFSTMISLLGLGGVLGGVFIANRRYSGSRVLCVAALALAVTMGFAATAPTVTLELIAMVPLGASAFVTIVLGQSTLQLATAPHMRGRVMAIWAMAVAGSTAIGGPIIGWIGDHLGARYGLVTGGIAALLAAALGYSALVRGQRSDGALEAVPRLASG